ncbi:MAG: SIS domain-containing protein [Sedimentisphaerales bacterium]|nr:SIS domain-containing protein [Sedimentisphaerales bacterium]
MNRKTKSRIVEIIDEHNRMVASLRASGPEIINDAAEAIIKALKKGGTIYICGNGGSAADAQHIASELVNRFECNRRALPAVALTTDSSIITSISNDSSYEQIFARQAEALVKKGDVFWALSTSGSSPNVLAGVKVARQKGAFIIAFTGRKNSTLERQADICLCANDKSAARSQEIHHLAYHIICGLVESRF